MKKIKSVIKKILFMFGIEIRCISNKNYSTAQGLFVKDAFSHNTKERINEFYSDPNIIEKYISPGRIAFYHAIINLCIHKKVLFSRKEIADVGCGTGHLLKFINDKFNDIKVTGLEYSDAAINVAKKICPKALFYSFDIYKGFSQQFDVVFCIEVLEHLLYPEIALKNCLKMINKKGTLIITVPNGRKDVFLGHINFWSPESWRILIDTNCKGLLYSTGLTENGENYAIIQKNN